MHVEVWKALKKLDLLSATPRATLKADLHGTILLTIVACDFYSARCSCHGKIAYDFHDIKLPVATIVVGF